MPAPVFRHVAVGAVLIAAACSPSPRSNDWPIARGPGSTQYSPLAESDPSAPGHIRAFDVRTGERAWIFHTIPRPGEAGYETWPPDAWRRAGGANSWAGMTVDQTRGLVFVPTGSAAPDCYGADRVGANLYANSLLALDARTGKRVWHYQFVHHDLWDRDLPAPPNLVTVEHDGRRIDAVAQITKSGHVFLFDRDAGQPLFPIEEHVVPDSDLPGESAWPTQPLPVKPPPFARQRFDPADVSTLSPEVHDRLLERLERVRSDGQFVPPSLEGTVILPGFDGGGEWGGAAVDADGMLYVNAIDLNAGEIRWSVTLGELPELAARGLPPTGTENYGGPLVTAGGVLFIAATKDEKFRAFDTRDGSLLWETDLPAGGYATPATYEVDGRQLVVIAAGGGKMGTKSGDAYVAFALPH